MERQQVDRATLAVHGERHLDPDDPTERPQPIRNGTNEERMTLIQESVDGPAAPGDRSLETRFDDGEDGSNRPLRQPIEMTTLDQGHGRLGNGRGRRDVLLAQAALTAERTQDSADPDIVHGRILKRPTYPVVA